MRKIILWQQIHISEQNKKSSEGIIYLSTRVEVREQSFGASSSSTTGGPRIELISYQTWRQAPILTEPSHWPMSYVF